jgi:predicted MFS family arabinose efflux permease
MQFRPSAESLAVFTRPLLTCCAITALIHAATYMLMALLPIHLVRLGGTKMQVGMLFSVSTLISMVLRPVVGGWIDRFGVRRVILPGVLTLAATSLAFHLAATPAAVVALMAGLGVSNGLISTSASVLAAQATAPERRGEALSVYYVATSLGFAVGAPTGFVLLDVGGMRLNFLVVTGAAAVMSGLALSLRAPPRSEGLAAAPGFRLWSRPALPVAGALILTIMGHSSVYGFLPLYAIANGAGRHVGWFFTLFSVWIIACRLVLRRISDRLGRTRVLIPAMGATAAAYLVLTQPPTAASLAVAAVLLATGGSVLYPTLLALVVDRAPARERGLAVGTLSGAFDLGVVVGSLLLGLVVERISYGAGFAMAATTTVLGLLTFVAMERRRRRPAVLPRPFTGV